MQQALNALMTVTSGVPDTWDGVVKASQAIEALRARLAEPVAWRGLTGEHYEAMAEQHINNCYFDTLTYARAIENKLKEMNCG